MSRVPLALGALGALALARALPADGVGLWLRLVAATLVLLAPGALVARAVGRTGAAATLVWSLVALAVALALTFALRTTLGLSLAVLALIALAALPLAVRRNPGLAPRGWAVVTAAGALFGVALWRVLPPAGGDALFHLARVRKLLDLDDLTLHRVTEFADGGLHPGYAFPLWHGFLALVARLAAVDPALVFRYEPSVLAPLAFLVAFEAGAVLFRSSWGGVAVVAAQVALTGLAAGNGGAFRFLGLPATAGGRLLLAPAVLALFFAFLRDPGPRALAPVAAGGLVLALVHPTYALFLGLVLAGFALARALVVRADVVRPVLGLAAFSLPAAAVLLWLLPIARETVSRDPSGEVLAGRAHGIERYPGQIDFFSEDRYRLAPEMLGRGGAVAVAALCAIPLAGLAGRRRWSAFVLGGSLALLVVLLTPALFPRLADAVSLSQARRAAGFLPLAFALAGGATVLARVGRAAVVPAALLVGIVLQRAFPGDFGYVLRGGGPAPAAWIALAGGAAALALAVGGGRRIAVERRGAVAGLAVLALVAPVAWDGGRRWERPPPAAELDSGLVAAVRAHAGPGDVVFSDPETSYRLAAAVPVYVAVSEPTHAADTTENRPYARKRDAETFFRTGDVSIARRYEADWVVRDRRRFRVELPLPRVYAHGRYVLYRQGETGPDSS